LYRTLSYFKKYHKENTDFDFYDWLRQKTHYIQDYEGLIKTYNLFELNNKNLELFENILIFNGPIIKKDVNNIIKIEGFIFPVSKN